MFVVTINFESMWNELPVIVTPFDAGGGIVPPSVVSALTASGTAIERASAPPIMAARSRILLFDESMTGPPWRPGPRHWLCVSVSVLTHRGDERYRPTACRDPCAARDADSGSGLFALDGDA